MSAITSTQNPKIKQIVRLKERKERDQTNLFLIEGYRELTRAVAAGVHLDAIYYCTEFFLGENEYALLDQSKVPCFRCTPGVFQKISYRDRPDGLIGIAEQVHLGLKDLQKAIKDKKTPFLVVCEAIEKPGNLGTILRSSDGVGVDGLIVCDKCTDIYNPNTVRASVGTLFTVPVFEATSDEAIRFLKEHQIQIVAATPSGSQEYTKVNFTGPVAIAMGCEQLGLSKKWMEQAELRVRIAMKGTADSLNVAMATTLLLYEVLRQRND